VTDFDAMSSDSENPPARAPTALLRARVVVLAIVSIQLLVLLISGVVLFFVYRPSGSAASGELFGDDLRSSIDLARIVRVAHQVAARSLLPTTVAVGVLAAIRGRSSARDRAGVLMGAGLVLLVVAGSFTGNLLAWDQLGIWAVSVGANRRGYLPLFGDDVRFVLIGGAEVGPGTAVRWLLVHMFLVGGVLSALLVVAWRRGTHQPALQAPDAAALTP
jgi:quinol---cytochrome c reductase cytochrome b subunit, bacillus type